MKITPNLADAVSVHSEIKTESISNVQKLYAHTNTQAQYSVFIVMFDWFVLAGIPVRRYTYIYTFAHIHKQIAFVCIAKWDTDVKNDANSIQSLRYVARSFRF